ncbi:LAFE_0B08548g1_1 [Lachancea fermentati]|uniref:LAFE_0B08548g1_1 n=1 Tax=Lachancea fermentati TaxID=4955 RepID=A0A1G4M8I2_LACFM|nr:LAFE_0B08548g1_1 [Lachancea fermentati]
MAVRKLIRKKEKAKKDPLALQRVVWTAGHAITLVCGGVYAVFYLFQLLTCYRYRSWKTLFLIARPPPREPAGWLLWLWRLTPQLVYRLSLVGVITAYTVSNYQSWVQLNPTWYDLLSKENFQSILIATLWLFSRASLFKLVPFLLNSYLHLTVKKDVNEQEATLKNKQILHVMAYSELVIIGTLLWDTLTFKDGTSGFVLVLFLGIYWLRLNFSPYAQVTLLRILLRIDKKVPASKKKQWEDIKNFLYLRIEENKKNRRAVESRL